MTPEVQVINKILTLSNFNLLRVGGVFVCLCFKLSNNGNQSVLKGIDFSKTAICR
jgi:hypothetical protein